MESPQQAEGSKMPVHEGRVRLPVLQLRPAATPSSSAAATVRTSRTARTARSGGLRTARTARSRRPPPAPGEEPCAICGEMIVAGEERTHCLECFSKPVCADCCELDDDSFKSVHGECVGAGGGGGFRARDRLPLEAVRGSISGETMRDWVDCMLATYSGRPMFGRLHEGAWRWASFGEVRGRARELGEALARLLPPRAVAGLITSRNTPEFFIACLYAGLVSAGLFASAGDEELEAQLRAAGAAAVLCGADLAPRLARLAPRCPALRYLVALRESLAPPAPEPEAPTARGGPARCALLREGQLPEAAPVPPAEIPVDPALSDPSEDIGRIIFTSGSTGAPKAVPLSNALFRVMTATNTFYCAASFVPAPFVAVQQAVWAAVGAGGRVGLLDLGPRLVEELASLRPTGFFAPPAFFEMVQKQALGRARAAGRPMDAEDPPRVPCPFGDRCERLYAGGALVAPAVREFFARAFGVRVADGYGCSETQGGVMVDGELCFGFRARLRAVPSLGIDEAAVEREQRGELLLHHPLLVPRYHNDPDESLEAWEMEGPWYRTGDVCARTPEGGFRLVDRLRNFSKLADGKFVSCAKLEALYASSPLVSRIFVHAAPGAPFTVAVCVPAPLALQGDGPRAAAAFADRVKAEFEELARRAGLAPREVPQRIVVDETVWTPGNGCLTSSGKPARAGLLRHYRARIEAALRGEDEAAPPAPGPNPQEKKESGVVGSEEEPRAPAAGAVSPAALAQEEEDKAAAGAPPPPEPEPEPGAEALRGLVEELTGRRLAEGDEGRTFAELGADSLLAAELAARLAERAPRAPPAALLTAVLRLPLRRLAAAAAAGTEAGVRGELEGHAAEQTARALAEDAQLPAAVIGASRLLPLRPAGGGARGGGGVHVLLTGATGFLGSHILAELLANKRVAAVTCLVRGAAPEECARRVADALRRFGLPEGSASAAAAAGRLRCLPAALEKPRLGLPEFAYDEARPVVHAAAAVDWLRPYPDLRAANVAATVEILSFAAHSLPFKRLHFVSSVAALMPFLAPAKDADEVARRHAACAHAARPLADGRTAVPPELLQASGYGQSKWVGEALVARACRAGLRADVYRAGYLSWSRRAGASNPADFLTRLLASAARLGAWPEAAFGARLNAAPVDCAAAFIAARAAAGPPGPAAAPAPGRLALHHLVNAEAAPLADLGAWLASAGYPAAPSPRRLRRRRRRRRRRSGLARRRPAAPPAPRTLPPRPPLQCVPLPRSPSRSALPTRPAADGDPSSVLSGHWHMSPLWGRVASCVDRAWLRSVPPITEGSVHLHLRWLAAAGLVPRPRPARPPPRPQASSLSCWRRSRRAECTPGPAGAGAGGRPCKGPEPKEGLGGPLPLPVHA
eukprot:tig00021254_g19701.t1